MDYNIRFIKKYSKVLNLLGAEPQKDGKYVVCYDSDFADALSNLKDPELVEKIESAIDALGKTPEMLYRELITSPLKDELKKYLHGNVNENEIIDEIESRLSEYDFSFYDVVDFRVESEPEIQMFGRFWSLPTQNAFVFVKVIDDDDEERMFLLQIDNAHHYEFDELEDRGS